ncbi:MAG: DMT family transporter [Pseudomonadota bacterium]|nr:DMT family transporter [Pseudomonadota bacterium]
MNAGGHQDSAGRGIALIMGGLLLLTINDATAKWLTDSYPVPQIISLRGITILLPLVIILYFRGGFAAFKPYRIRNQALRALCFVGSTFFIITALSMMPLADAVAFTFTGPLIIAVLAPFLLSEHVGWRRWSAIIVGFVGVVLIARPTPDAFQWAALVALGAAFWSALRDMVTRRISAEESSDLILFYSTVAVMTVGVLAAFVYPWRMPNAEDWALFALLGVLNGGAHYMIIEAHRWAEASVIAPFRYTALVWAFILGYFLWGDVPDAWLLSGSALVVASGLYILHRETRPKQS